YGDHALSCASGNNRIKKHDIIVRQIYKEMTKINLNCRLEPKNLINGTRSRPADIIVTNLFNNEVTWLDVGITQTQLGMKVGSQSNNDIKNKFGVSNNDGLSVIEDNL